MDIIASYFPLFWRSFLCYIWFVLVVVLLMIVFLDFKRGLQFYCVFEFYIFGIFMYFLTMYYLLVSYLYSYL